MNNIKGFYKEYKLLFWLLIFAVFLAIKNSDIPVFDLLPYYLKVVFMKPRIPGVSSFVDGIVFSFIASIIFFYVVSFLPEQKAKKDITIIVSPIINSIHVFLCDVVMALDCAKLEQQVKSYDEIRFESGLTYYIKRYVDGDSPLQEFIEMEKDCSRSIKAAFRDCEKLFSIPGYSYVDDSVKKSLAIICSDSTLMYTLGNASFSKGIHCMIGLEKSIESVKCAIDAMEKWVPLKKYTFEILQGEELSEYIHFLDENREYRQNDQVAFYMGKRVS